jgi:hypothetical protein
VEGEPRASGGSVTVNGPLHAGLQASFEAFVCVQDQDASRKLEQFSQCMQELEDNLPISDAHKNKLGASQPIVAVNLVRTVRMAGMGVRFGCLTRPAGARRSTWAGIALGPKRLHSTSPTMLRMCRTRANATPSHCRTDCNLVNYGAAPQGC